MDNRTKLIIISALFAVSAISAGYFYINVIKDSQLKLPDTSRGEIVKQPAAEVVEEKIKTGYRGQIMQIEGQAEGRNDGTGEWRKLSETDIIYSGTEIKTSAASRMAIKFEDGSEARLDEKTQIRFESSENTINLILSSGDVYNKVAKNSRRTYGVNVAAYSVTAIGTIFDVRNGSGGVPEITTLENQVEVKDNQGKLLQKIENGKTALLKLAGIEADDIAKAKLSEKFLAWNIEKDKLVIKTKEEILDENSKKINLSAKEVEKGVELSWKVGDLEITEGFKIMKSEKEKPAYPGDEYKYISDNETRTMVWEMKNGEKYHFRICQYVNGKCSVYSNDIVPTKADDGDYAAKIDLSVEKNGQAADLKWKISGGDAPKGFKVIMDKEKDPEYPDDENKYIDDPDKRSYSWEDLETEKTYHFRVCVYNGKDCEIYSDDEKVDF